jgi:hypothetical protein
VKKNSLVQNCYGHEVSFLSSESKCMSQDDVVITATRLQAGQSGIWFDLTLERKMFVFAKASRTDLMPAQPFIAQVLGDLPCG